MAESYSVKAVLSAEDRGFSSAFKNASGSMASLGSSIKSGLGFGVLMGVGQQAFSAISSGFAGLVKETIGTSDSMQKLQQAMRFSGTSEAEIKRIAGATGTLKTYADKTVFSLNDVMSTFGALSANGVKDADKMTEAVGNAVAVFGGGANEFSGVALAFSQSMASGKMNAQDWNQIINASPQLAGGLRKELVRLNPVLGDDFKGAMEKGAITADLLGQAMTNIGMTDMAKEASQSVTTFEGAMGNFKATAANGILEIYDTFAKAKIVDVINVMNAKIGSAFGWLSTNIPAVIKKVKPYFNILKDAGKEVKGAFGEAFSAIAGEVKKLIGSFGGEKNISNFSDVIGVAGDALKTFAGFLKENADIIAKVLTHLPQLLVAYAGFKILKSITPLAKGFTTAIGGLASKGIDGLSSKLFGVSKGQEAVGKSSKTSSAKMLTSAKSFMMLGAGVLMVSGGFALLAYSAIALANAGPLAIGVMVGLVAALAGLGAGMVIMLNSIKPGPAKLKAISVAMLAMGVAVVLVAAGLALLAFSAISLASAGPLAIGVMIGLVAAIALLAIGAAILGPALTAGAVGFIAFGAAIALVGVGALLAATALMLVAGVLPTIIQYSVSGAIAIAQLSLGMIAFATGAALAGAGCIVLGAGLAVVAVGLLLVGVAVLVAAAGVLALAAGALVLGAGLTLTATALMLTATALPIVAAGALLCMGSFTALLAISVALAATLLVLDAPLLLLGASSLVASVGMLAFGVAMTVGCVGVLAMSVALKLVNSSMKSIASNAKTASSSIKSMVSSIDIVNSGLDALGSKAKSAVSSFVKAFSGGVGNARTAGTALANGVKDGVQTGLTPLPAVALLCMASFNSALQSGGNTATATARSMSTSIVSALQTASSGAYSCGYYIGIGLANGMRATLGTVRSVAAQLAAAAEAAVIAKAKIGSPSRVFRGLGAFMGEGLAIGIDSMQREVAKTSENLVAIPALASGPDIASGYSTGIGQNRTLNNEYSYHGNTTYTITVPLEVEGREIAKATAVYTQEELNKMERRNSRKSGIK